MTTDSNPGSPRHRPGDQIPPKAPPGSDSVQDALIELVSQRRDLGVKRYGQQLQTFNGRDALQDALEEAVDLASYLTQLRMETQALSADGGTGTLVEILGRSGVDVSRDNIIRVSQIVERLQRWSHAQIAARTNHLARQTADARDERDAAQRELERIKQRLDWAETRIMHEVEANHRRQEMLLAAWEPCGPGWVSSHGPNACAFTARAWIPRDAAFGPSHYHPRGFEMERDHQAEREVQRADSQADSQPEPGEDC